MKKARKGIVPSVILGWALFFCLAAAIRDIRAEPASTKEPAAINQDLIVPETSESSKSQIVFMNSLGMPFVEIPGTSTLFCIWKTRVRDYQTFVRATHREVFSPDFSQTPYHPAVMVSWEDAQAFCFWLNETEHASNQLAMEWKYRLPTDAEWNLAVGISTQELSMSSSATPANIYVWGNDWPPPTNVANFHPSLHVDSFANTSPVGSFKPNMLGLFDVSGNAWEWCQDLFNESADYRVLRGGSWRLRNPGDLLLKCRVGNLPYLRLDTYGFRVAIEKPIPPPPSQSTTPKKN